MTPTPCLHLIEDPPRCAMGRRVPEDCGGCAAYEPGLDARERTRCEVWTRVMGYHRPLSAFNPGKQSEHVERVLFKETPHG